MSVPRVHLRGERYGHWSYTTWHGRDIGFLSYIFCVTIPKNFLFHALSSTFDADVYHESARSYHISSDEMFFPAADTIISTCFVFFGEILVLLWQIVTVAPAWRRSIERGLPTIVLLPMTATSFPLFLSHIVRWFSWYLWRSGTNPVHHLRYRGVPYWYSKSHPHLSLDLYNQKSPAHLYDLEEGIAREWHQQNHLYWEYLWVFSLLHWWQMLPGVSVEHRFRQYGRFWFFIFT